MNCSAAILRQWRREDPDRLLQAALSQADRLAEVAPELEALRSQNASLHEQLELKTKRIAQLEEALEAAQRAAHRQAAPFRLERKRLTNYRWMAASDSTFYSWQPKRLA